MRCLEKLPEDRFSSMDELLGALVGLGLYAPQRVPEVTSPHKRRSRRDVGRRTRRPAARARHESAEGPGRRTTRSRARASGLREQARELARKRRASGVGRYWGPSAPS